MSKDAEELVNVGPGNLTEATKAKHNNRTEYQESPPDIAEPMTWGALCV